MSNEADGNAREGGCTLAERGCLAGKIQRSDRFCKPCIYSPLKNLWPTIKDWQELRNKRIEQLNKFAPNQGRAWVCVMQCEEHVEEPWVDLVIEASIKHQIKYTNKKELGDTEERLDKMQRGCFSASKLLVRGCCADCAHLQYASTDRSNAKVHLTIHMYTTWF
tara:strand:+ start:964 stop:1455 length:492 start_codon:yes stop_codon:yes gene_type:complete